MYANSQKNIWDWAGTATSVNRRKRDVRVLYRYSTTYRLGHCATNRKVACSLPDGVIGTFYWNNPSGRTMALGLTQPLTEMSTRNIFWGQRRPVPKADSPTTFMCRLSWNLGASTSWNSQGLPRPVKVLLYLYVYLYLYLLLIIG